MFAKKFKSFVVLQAEDSVDLMALNDANFGKDVDGIWTNVNLDFTIAEGTQAHTIGLVRFEDDNSYVKEFSGLQVVNVGQSVKKVNKKTVKRKVKEKIEELEKQHIESGSTEEFHIDKETKKNIEADITFAMLPSVEAEDFYNYLVVDKQDKKVYILNATKKVSEEITSFLRGVLGTFSVVPFSEHEDAIISGFGKIMEDHEADRLTLGNYIKLEDDEGVVVWSKESLYESKAVELMEAGKQVVAIGLEYDGVVCFIVDKDFKVSGLKFPKHFNEEGSLEANMILCFNEVRGIMKDLIKATIQK